MCLSTVCTLIPKHRRDLLAAPAPWSGDAGSPFSRFVSMPKPSMLLVRARFVFDDEVEDSGRRCFEPLAGVDRIPRRPPASRSWHPAASTPAASVDANEMNSDSRRPYQQHGPPAPGRARRATSKLPQRLEATGRSFSALIERWGDSQLVATAPARSRPSRRRSRPSPERGAARSGLRSSFSTASSGFACQKSTVRSKPCHKHEAADAPGMGRRVVGGRPGPRHSRAAARGESVDLQVIDPRWRGPFCVRLERGRHRRVRATIALIPASRTARGVVRDGQLAREHSGARASRR